MSEISSERRLAILRALGSAKCESCGGTKRPKMSHCRKCYYALPLKMKGALYRGFGDGYEQAYEESLQFLKSKEAAPLSQERAVQG